jgi:ribose transport system permease protein
MIPLALALGIGSGIFTGMTIALTRANPVIVTFAMLSFFEGATYLYSQVSIGTTPANLSWLESERVFGLVPVAALLFAVLAIVAWLLLARTPFGSHLRAVGGNEPSARRNGVPITRTKVLAYALSGFSGAAAGLLLDARLQTGYPGAGTGLELSAIVAVIVGGTPFGGGRGTVLGTVAGALLLTVLVNALNLLNVGTEVQQIVNGAVVVVAVSLYSVRRFHRWL